MAFLDNCTGIWSSLVKKLHVTYNWKFGVCVFTSSVCSVGMLGVLRLRHKLIPSKWPVTNKKHSLLGKLIVVTGSNTGIGKEIARQFALWDANVILACRSQERGEKTAAEIRKALQGNNSVTFWYLDLESFESVRNFVHNVKASELKIDILINNAAVYGCPYKLTKDGFETQFQVNYLSQFLLTNLLIKHDALSSEARIICVGSGLYKKGSVDFSNLNGEVNYAETRTYSNTKLEMMHFVKELANRLPKGMTVNCAHPGIALTELARHRIKSYFKQTMLAVVGWLILRTPYQGAIPIIGTAIDPSLDNVSGMYFGYSNKPEEISSNAEDSEVAAKLWNISEEFVGETFAK